MAAETSIVITAQAGQAEGTMRSLGDSIDGVSKRMLSMSSLAGSLGGALSLTAFATFITSTNNGVDALNDLYDATGSSIENLSALEDRAARTGTSMDSVGATLIKFNNVLNEAKPGSAQELALKAIGLNATELRKLDPAEALRQTAVALSQFADDGNKARLVQDLFGKGVREMAPLLKDLAEGGALVAKVTTQQAQEAEKFNHELAALKKNAIDANRALVGDLVTGINKAAQAMRESGLVEAIRTLLTGDDQYKNNKRLVELTNDLLRAENALSASRVRDAQFGDKSVATVAAEKRLAAIKAELQTVQGYRQMIDQQGAAASGAGGNEPDKSVGTQIDPAELKAQNEVLLKMAGLTGTFATEWERLGAMFKSGKISLEELTEAQADLLSSQPKMKEQAKLTKDMIDGEVKKAEVILAEGERIDEMERKQTEERNKAGEAKVQAFIQQTETLGELVAQQDMTEEERILYKRDQEFVRLEEQKQILIEHNEWTLQMEAQYGMARYNLQSQASSALIKLEKQQAQQKQQVLVSSLSTISSLMSSNNETMFRIGQAAAIANVTISTYEGAAKAVGQLGIWGIPVAAAIVAAGLMQVNQIASTQIGGGTPSPVNATFSGGSVSSGSDPSPITSPNAMPNAGAAEQRQQVNITFQGSGRYTYDEVVNGIAPLLKEANSNGAVDVQVAFA